MIYNTIFLLWQQRLYFWFYVFVFFLNFAFLYIFLSLIKNNSPFYIFKHQLHKKPTLATTGSEVSTLLTPPAPNSVFRYTVCPAMCRFPTLRSVVGQVPEQRIPVIRTTLLCHQYGRLNPVLKERLIWNTRIVTEKFTLLKVRNLYWFFLDLILLLYISIPIIVLYLRCL